MSSPNITQTPGSSRSLALVKSNDNKTVSLITRIRDSSGVKERKVNVLDEDSFIEVIKSNYLNTLFFSIT